MRLAPERLIGLRWLLLSAVSAGACGGTMSASKEDGGSSGSGSQPTAGTHSSVGGSGTTTITGGGSATTSGSATTTLGSAGEPTVSGGASVGGSSNPSVGGDAQVGGGGTDVGPQEHCTSPVTKVSGFVTCGNGLVHREAAVACANNLPQEPVSCGVEPNLYVCDGSKLERCGHLGGGQAPATSCDSACLTDADCPTGQLCHCGAMAGTCVPASCTVDADCGTGFLCRQVMTEFGYGCGATMTFQCQLAADQCASAADCGTDQRCQPMSLGEPVRCEPIAGVACGRPYLVHGAPRLACASADSSWAASLELDPTQLDGATRQALADGWQALGLMEHASVAAFARFTLQLLSLGAPHTLVVESNRAIADETRHAELCFGLAAAFGSAAPGPGALDSQGALDRLALREVVLDTFLEGCIGETIATLEASEALAGAAFSSVRDVLQQIGQDEARHASLAWRFVAWGVTQEPELLHELRASFERELERAELACASGATRAAAPAGNLAVGGIVDDATRLALRRMALRDLIAPCLEALEAGRERTPEAVRLHSAT